MGKPCNKSWIYAGGNEAFTDTSIPQLISLCDRVPPGKYGLVRNANLQSYSMPTITGQARNAGLRGLAFLLGDDTAISVKNMSNSYRVEGIDWSPSGLSYAPSYQRIQDMLNKDRLNTDPLNGQMAGPYTMRNQDLVCGGLFICRDYSFHNPAHVGQVIAEIRNYLGLDFIMIDIDDPSWNDTGGGFVATTLAQTLQNNFRRSANAPDRPSLSSHCPVFFITPRNTNNAQNLANYLDRSNVFEPVVNGKTGSTTFVAPRIDAGYPPLNGAIEIWSWGKPYEADGRSISPVHATIDIRNSIISAANITQYLTDEVNGLTITYPGVNRTFSVNSGCIFYDDMDAILAKGAQGRTPTTHWNMDVDGGFSPWGTIVPSIYPDPVLPVQVGSYLYDPKYGGLKIVFENWKTGHVSATNIPLEFNIYGSTCSSSQVIRDPIGSWITFDGVWMTSQPAARFFAHLLDGNITVLSGTPQAGDEGLYPLFIEVLGSQDRSINAVNANWTTFLLVLDVKDYPTNKELNYYIDASNAQVPLYITDPVEGDGNLHPKLPSPEISYRRLPYAWNQTEWCVSQNRFIQSNIQPVPYTDVYSRGVGIPPNNNSLCGVPFRNEMVSTLIDACNRWGIDGNGPLPICTTSFNNIAEYIGFFMATASVLSNMYGLYSNPTIGGFGILSLPQVNFSAGDYFNLFNIAFSLDAGHFALEAAWNDARDFTNFACAGDTYEHRVRHAFTFFVDYIGLYTGAHGGNFDPSQYSTWHTRGCDINGGLYLVQFLMDNNFSGQSIQSIATCFKTAALAGQIPGLGGGSSGAVTGGGSGTQPYGTNQATICRAITAARSAGFRDDIYTSEGYSELRTIVAIAIGESGLHYAQDDPLATGHVGSVSYRGILQYSSLYPPSDAIAYDPSLIPQFQEAYSRTHSGGTIIGGVAPCGSGFWGFNNWEVFNCNTNGNHYTNYLGRVNQAVDVDCIPNTSPTFNCPIYYLNSGGISITASCEWHVEQSFEFNKQALDLSGSGSLIYLVSPCDGTLYYYGMDPRPGFSSCTTQDSSGATVTLTPGGLGFMAVIDCNDGRWTHVLGHMTVNSFSTSGFPVGYNNTPVSAGQIIGVMGDTGCAFGTHTHWEVWDRTKVINGTTYHWPTDASLYGSANNQTVKVCPNPVAGCTIN